MEKIRYREIRYDDFKDYKWSGMQDKERFTKFLFHGTRKGPIDESMEKIETLHNECDAFMSYLKENIFRILSEMGLSSEEQYEKLHQLLRVEIYKKTMFEYGVFYLTLNYLLAMAFSAYEAGELCDSCYQNAMDIKKPGIVFEDEKINGLMERIIEKHEEYGKTEKVVLAVPNVLFDDMQFEGGSLGKDLLRTNLYYGKVDLRSSCNQNMRLNNPGSHEFLLIHENEIKRFIPLFTGIKKEEVDELRNSYIYDETYNSFSPK